ncbi:hypothetical protein QW131_30760 [Roseibium salinum]|nr:hypothetical protein [Roseibium salinum]
MWARPNTRTISSTISDTFSSPLYAITYFARFSAGFYLPVLLLYRYLDPALGRMLICFAVPFLASAAYFGRLVEQRVVVEVVPLLWLCAMQAVWAYSRAQARAAEAIPVRYPQDLPQRPDPIGDDGVAVVRTDADWLRISAAHERVSGDGHERHPVQDDTPPSWNRRREAGHPEVL